MKMNRRLEFQSSFSRVGSGSSLLKESPQHSSREDSILPGIENEPLYEPEMFEVRKPRLSQFVNNQPRTEEESVAKLDIREIEEEDELYTEEDLSPRDDRMSVEDDPGDEEEVKDD